MLNAKIYVSSIEKIEGKIREEPEDFLVEEITEFKPKGVGENIWILVEKRKTSTVNVAMQIARNLHISRKKIGFAGMKDSRAIARQWFSVTQAKVSDLEKLELNNASVKKIIPHTKKLRLGRLIGNKFEILIKTKDKDIQKVEDILSELKEKGVANYFGWQRFGYVRPNTHLVGKAIVENDLKKAVDIYIGHPYDRESEKVKLARKKYDNGEIEKSLNLMPKKMSYERMMLKSLLKNPAEYKKAIESIPIPIKTLFVSAYQSYLFNYVTSERIKYGINKTIYGDIFINNQEKIVESQDPEKDISNFEIHPTAPLFGSKVPIATGKMGEIENKIIKKEKIDLGNFECREIPKLGSYGLRRSIRFKISDTKVEIDPQGIKISFFIPKGCYATSVLREIVKGDII